MANNRSTGTGSYALLMLRLVAGLVFLLHGLPKWGNLGGVAQFFGSLGIPAPGLAAPLIALLETVGGVALIAGVATRYLGVLFALEMLVVTLIFKLPRLGIVATMGAPAPGAELDLTLMAAALVLAVHGAGRFSLEEDVLKRRL